jgi:L-asparaginase II
MNEQLPAHVPLAVATRGGRVESVHYGSAVVVDRRGAVQFALGDPAAASFTRSSLKPLQAMPFMARRGERVFGFSAAQTALLCASHSGEAHHVEAVADMLALAGNEAGDLQCGTHRPRYFEDLNLLPGPEVIFTPLHNNCSGKHAGMLACCRMMHEPVSDYLGFDHPLQKEIRAAVAHFCGVPEQTLLPGVDGCSAFNYAVPLQGLALAFARLASEEPDERYGDAPQRLFAAMTAHPEMVSGTGRIDNDLMRAGGGDWVTKIGAEGVYAIGLRSLGLGLAVKIADGNARALGPVILALLRRVSAKGWDAPRLAPWAVTPILNCRGRTTGEVRSILD